MNKKKYHNILRRDFIRESVLMASALSIPLYIPSSVFSSPGRPGANERIGLAGIGVGRQGSYKFKEILKDKRTTAICVCDVWKSRAEKIAKETGSGAFYQDWREVLDRKDVDAIMTATPEHWRGLICVTSALAGKHLYVEKPITLTIDDGIQIRRAVQKTGIIFQSGSMQRSYLQNYLGCQFIREGGLGKIKEVIAANYESPWLARLPEEKMPEDLDWELWSGPVDPVPFCKDLYAPRANPGWLSFRPYSGGEMTGWGTHGFDQIQCALGMDHSGPVEILVEGDKLTLPVYDKPESSARGNKICSTPKLAFRYASGLTVRLDNANRGGGIFIGEKGKMEIFRGRAISNPPELFQNYLKKNANIKIPTHESNWIDCIYSGVKPLAHLESGIRTATICHLLNIARSLGKGFHWDPVKETVTDCPDALPLLKRESRKGYEIPQL